MTKRNEILILVLFLVLLIVAGIVGFYFVSTSGKSKLAEKNNQDSVSESVEDNGANPDDYVTDFEPNTLKLERGNFESIENGKVYIKDEASTKDFELNNELIIVCAQQDLVSITVNDYGDSEILFSSPGNLGTIIQSGEPIVAFTQEVAGVPTMHTIYVSSSKCPLQ